MVERGNGGCDTKSHKRKLLRRLFPDKTLKLYSRLIPIISPNCQKFSNLNFSPPVKARERIIFLILILIRNIVNITSIFPF